MPALEVKQKVLLHCPLRLRLLKKYERENCQKKHNIEYE